MKDLLRNAIKESDLDKVSGGIKAKEKEPDLEKVPVPVPPIIINPIPTLEKDKIDISFPSGSKPKKDDKKK